jgi:hypothetical protein
VIILFIPQTLPQINSVLKIAIIMAPEALIGKKLIMEFGAILLLIRHGVGTYTELEILLIIALRELIVMMAFIIIVHEKFY